MKEFNFEIVENIAVLSVNESKEKTYTKELNLVSYNGKEPVYDLRRWAVSNEEKTPLKGISFTKKELVSLKETLEGLKI